MSSLLANFVWFHAAYYTKSPAGICYNILGMNRNMKMTLKAWPVITVLTIAIFYLTQLVAGWFGVELPDQANLDIVRKYIGWNKVFILLCAQVLFIMPAVEEFVFRWLAFMLPARIAAKRAPSLLAFDFPLCILSSALFSAAHYITQPWPDAAFIALFFFGLVQCRLYQKTDRIWCPMLNHFLFNLTNLALLVVLPQQ